MTSTGTACPATGGHGFPRTADGWDRAAGLRSGGPLSGLVVADFSRVLAGPYATMLLADMGATVIKVESPSGDDTRSWSPPAHEDVATYYLSLNRNKHSVALDFADLDDLATACRIIDAADVFVENFKPGSLARFGLDPASVAERWPHIVHASVTGFGSAGGAAMPGYDLLIQGISGLMSITGSPDGPPQRAGVAMFDVMTGLHTAIGILSALHERRDSGRGQHVELDLLSSALSGLVNQSAAAVAGGVVPTRLGNDHPSVYPYGPFPARDTELIIAVGNDRQFQRLMDALGKPEVADDERYATMAARNRNRADLCAIIVDVLAARDAMEWFRDLQALGIACAPILDIASGVEFAADLGLDPVVNVGTAGDSVPMIRHPITFGRTPAIHDKRPPTLDGDRESVLRWLTERPAAHG